MASVRKLDSLPGFCTPKKNKKTAVECLKDDDDDSPLRPIFCLKRKSAIKEFDDKEDCFILDFNPEEDSFDLSKISVEKGQQNDPQDSPDISLLAEKGQVFFFCLLKPLKNKDLKLRHQNLLVIIYKIIM